MKLIGFSGYARCGKDTAAKALISQGWERRAFADALKDDVWTAMNTSWMKASRSPCSPDYWKNLSPDCSNIPRDIFSNPEKKEIFRPLLVEYGRAMRKLCADYWVVRLESEILSQLPMLETGVVVTDVRYKNEADMIRASGGCVITIVRPGQMPANEEEARNQFLVEADATVVNSGTVEDLAAAVNAAIDRLSFNKVAEESEGK